MTLSCFCAGAYLYFKFDSKVGQTDSAVCLNYHVEKIKFSTDYEKCNPLTMKQA